MRKRGSKSKCAHCRQIKVWYCRGLCAYCYRIPGVKESHPSLYKVTGKYKGESKCPVGNGGYHPPEAPITARPGSEEKIMILQKRALEGSSLWHIEDSFQVDLS